MYWSIRYDTFEEPGSMSAALSLFHICVIYQIYFWDTILHFIIRRHSMAKSIILWFVSPWRHQAINRTEGKWSEEICAWFESHWSKKEILNYLLYWILKHGKSISSDWPFNNCEIILVGYKTFPFHRLLSLRSISCIYCKFWMIDHVYCKRVYNTISNRIECYFYLFSYFKP